MDLSDEIDESSPIERSDTGGNGKTDDVLDPLEVSDPYHKREVCIVTTGNVDSGKSSSLGVLMSGELDDGNGSARAKVAKHPHEVTLGKTSDIAVRPIKLNDHKELVMIDLCGHEKYLKTTLFGITGHYPDYAILFISGNNGIMKMTREHMGILLYMNIPFIILITRVDITQKGMYDRTISTLDKILKKFKRKLKMINTMDDYLKLRGGEITAEQLKQNELPQMLDVEKYAKIMNNDYHTVPCITISNKSGYGIDVTRRFLECLEPRKDVWNTDSELKIGSLMYIDDKFTPPGIGLVVSGVVKGQPIKIGDKMFIGPYQGKMIPIKIWSIHDNTKHNVDSIKSRHRGCVAFRVLDKKINFGKPEIRKGMVIISENITKNVCLQFKCTIKVLNHSTTISERYSPVIHCGTVRQAAKIVLDKGQTLKMGDKADVSFRFLDRPEFMEVGSKFFFREGTTRGVGNVIEVLSIDDDPDPTVAEPKKPKKKRRVRQSNRTVRNMDSKEKPEDPKKRPTEPRRKIDVL
jgi:elongation factor 1-alpha